MEDVGEKQMKAQVTDDFDLVLRWEDEARCEVVWSPCSNCEFEVTARLWFPPGLNYQGPTRLDFSTTCYAYALRFFADELEEYSSGQRPSADYRGSEDMTIALEERRGQCDFKDRTVIVSVLKYEMMRTVNMVVCDTEFELLLGRPEDPKGTAKAIREVISNLKMDDTVDGSHNQEPPNKTEQDNR